MAIGGVESKIELKVYLLDDVKLIDQREIEVKLREQDGVKEIEYESREQALKNFEDMMKDTPGLLEGYTLKNNPLPASYIVRLTDPSYAEAISEAVQDLPGVESIGNQQDVINQIHGIVKVVRVVGIVLFIILIGVSIFLIMNTTKLTVYSRRREVGIMKFVGATDWFIRWPFIIEGMVIGLLGAILSIIGVYFIYRFGVGIIANNILIAVRAFSPPDSKFKFFIFLPGGFAVIWISLSSILSSSNIVSSPSPPPNSLLYTYLKFSLT